MTTFNGRALVPASIGLAIALALLGFVMARAIAVEAPPPIEPPSNAEPIPAEPPEIAPLRDPDRPLSEEVVQLVADADPFMQERERAERYLLPSERIEPRDEEPPPPAPPFRLIGTAVVGDGGIAVMQVEDETPQLLNVGDYMQGYRLASVQPFKAIMEGQGRTVDVPVTPPSPNPTAERSARTSRGRGNANSERARERFIETMSRQLDQLRQRGASPAMLEQLMQRINQAREGEIRVDGGRIIFNDDGRGIEVRRERNRDTLEVPAPRLPRN